MVLQSHPALVRPAAPLRFEIKFLLWDRLPLGVVSDLDTIQNDDSMRPIECDLHRVPLGPGLAWTRQRLGQRVKASCYVIVVFIGLFWFIIDLDFIAVMHWHPLFAGLDRNPDEHSRIGVVIPHLEDNADLTITHLACGPV